MNAFTLRTLALADVRIIGRDPLLKWVLALPLGLALVLRVLMPRIRTPSLPTASTSLRTSRW